MIKGCNRRVIVMKDTGNDMIEEAIFVLKSAGEKNGFSENDIIRHANSILDDGARKERFSSLSMNVTKPKRFSRLSGFLSGLVIGALTAGAIAFIL